MPTRRDTTKLILAGAASLAFPAMGKAATAEEWAATLQEALSRATPAGCGTRLTLLSFGFDKRGRTAGMSAVVQMDWPPGLRRRRFDASEQGEQEAYARLWRDILREFGSANPGCVV